MPELSKPLNFSLLTGKLLPYDRSTSARLLDVIHNTIILILHVKEIILFCF